MKLSLSWIGGEKKRYCPYCGKNMTKKDATAYYCKKCEKSFRGRKIPLGLFTLRISMRGNGFTP